MSLGGLVLVDKPAGPSSFGVLRSLRPALGPKLGHAGTLDPFATGLLLVLVGRATRLAQFLSGADKRYCAEVQFGARSTTLDPEGELEPTGELTTAPAVRSAASRLVGEVIQQVPAASAVRIDGRRSYERMRRGETVTAPPRPVRIDALDVVSFDSQTQRAQVDVACSKGTYIRQIAADLGDATGAGAYCSALRRTMVGEWSVQDAGTPADVLADPQGPWWRSPAEAVGHLPARELTGAEREHVCHGRAIASSGEAGPNVRLVFEGELVAVAAAADGELRPRLVLA